MLNGKVSSWATVSVRAPQGFILNGFLLLIYINDLVDRLTLNVRLFADEFFWSVFSRNRSEYKEIINSIRIRKNANQKNFE